MTTLNIQLPSEIRPEEAALLLAVKLWETGRLSLGQAAELAGYSKSAFIEVAGRQGLAVFNHDPEDLEKEANL